jgi:hypothetical protein
VSDGENPTFAVLTLLALNAGVEGVAANDTSVFWVEGASIGRIARDGGAKEDPWQAGENGANAIAVEGDDVFWTRVGTTGGFCHRNAQSATVTCPFSGNVNQGRIVVDRNSVYVAVEQENRIMRFDREARGVTEVASNIDQPVGIAQDATAIYFAARGSGTIYRMVK